MSKDDKSSPDRRIKIGKDATGSVIISGDGNVVTISGGNDLPGERSQGDVPKVFISSNSEDLKEHRAAARDAAIATGFLPIQMEYFAASGEHKPLAACLHKVSEADVVVVIVAHRYGWVPEDQEPGQHKSITWLECEQANSEKKEILAFIVDDEHAWPVELRENYRIAAAVSSGNATMELLGEVTRNVKRLADFKDWINGLGIRAKFSNVQDLGWKVSQALADWKQRHVRPDTAASDKKSVQSQHPIFPPAYREWLLRQCADIDLVGLRLKETRYVKLNHVYVPVTTPASRDQTATDTPTLRDRLEREPKVELLLNRLNEGSLYVSGAPGSGKSTFCRWVAWLTCTGAMPEQHEAEPDELREQFPASLRGRLPILIRLRDFWNFLPQGAGEGLSLAQFDQALERWLTEKKPGDLTWVSVAAHLEQGAALVIFDGVDEVPISQGDRGETWYPRASLLSGLGEAVAGWTPKGNRLLVTSRPYGLTEAERHKLGLADAPIDDLPRPLQRLLAARWFRILTEDSSVGDALANEMLADIARRPGIDKLSLSPMLLTAMCVIYREGKRLPQDRCDLYDRIVENVLYNRVRDPAKIEIVRNELRVVAHEMHTGNATGRSRTSPEAEVDWQEIDHALESYREKSRWTEEGFTGTVASREFLLSHTGLLLPRSGKRAAFYHLSIQEFLAAERLADMSNEELADLFRRRSEAAEWHNTLGFVFGTVQNASVDRSVMLVEQLLKDVEQQQLGLQIVIGDALQILLAKNIRLQSDREAAYRQLCLSAIEREVSLRERNLLGLALGHLGDPRIVTDLRDRSAYVGEFPAGEYAYQDGKQKIDQPFLLAKYPVTNSQFALFVEDGGYTQHKHWSKPGWAWKEENAIYEPRLWRDARFNAPNQPVVGVSFYEAEACCKWAGGFLPSEQQWEAAARGREGREYPWSGNWKDGICNSAEAGLGVTSPVGLFPRSKSLDFDLEDMAGNVWEWCDSFYVENLASRVLRGGAFNFQARLVRSANRDRNRLAARNSYVGFRLARTYP